MIGGDAQNCWCCCQAVDCQQKLWAPKRVLSTGRGVVSRRWSPRELLIELEASIYVQDIKLESPSLRPTANFDWDEMNESESCCVLRWSFLVSHHEREKPRHPCFTLFSLVVVSWMEKSPSYFSFRYPLLMLDWSYNKVLSTWCLPGADRWLPGLCLDMHSYHLKHWLLMSNQELEGWGMRLGWGLPMVLIYYFLLLGFTLLV